MSRRISVKRNRFLAFRQELLVALFFTSEFLFREDILFVDGAAFTKGGHQ